MWVYYDDLDGRLYPKWLILKADNTKDYPYYSLDAPFERFYPEDMTDEFRAITVDMGELFVDPFEDYSFGISVTRLREKYDMNEITHFILLCDHVEEVLEMDLSYRFRKTS